MKWYSIIVPSYKMKGRYCTMVLVRSFQVIPISQQSPDSLSQTVFVWLLGSLIKQNVGDQTRISTILHILRYKGQMWVGVSKNECFSPHYYHPWCACEQKNVEYNNTRKIVSVFFGYFFASQLVELEKGVLCRSLSTYWQTSEESREHNTLSIKRQL